jgi:hypothetical protein
MSFFTRDTRSAAEAKAAAQWIAFAPMVFQATKALRDLGILEAVERAGAHGLTLEEVTAQVKLPPYGVRVLMEAGLGIGLLLLNDQRYTTTRTAQFVLHDRMTRVNMDFVHDVNYKGLYHLSAAITQGAPVGLRELDGDHATVYAALASLPDPVRRSWFAFEHFCSAQAFQEALPLVFDHPVQRLLDVGANTGKWALACAAYSPNVTVTMCDLPAQLDLAIENVAQNGLSARIKGYPLDILSEGSSLPSGHDVIWMSQFLDCFSEDEIVAILRKTASAMSPEARLLILETYWDRQLFENAAFCLQQISLYFTCVANGNSQLYHSAVMHACIERAGLRIERETDHVGLAHTLTVCVRK